MDCWTCQTTVTRDRRDWRGNEWKQHHKIWGETNGANSTNYRHLFHVMIARVENRLGALLLSVFVFAVTWHYADFLGVLFSSATRSGHHGGVKVCPQVDALYPERHKELWRSLGREFNE